MIGAKSDLMFFCDGMGRKWEEIVWAGNEMVRKQRAKMMVRVLTDDVTPVTPMFYIIIALICEILFYQTKVVFI